MTTKKTDLRELKDRVLDAINFQAEFDELLGPGKGTTRRCFNKPAHGNNDKSPSLSFSAANGTWRCHSCQLGGDIFALFREASGESYSDCLMRLSAKYNVGVPDVGTQSRPSSKPKPTPWKVIFDTSQLGWIDQCANYFNKTSEQREELVSVLVGRYGLNMETIRKWHIGYDSVRGRLTIPVPQYNLRAGNKLANMVNVRMHDVLRRSASWENQVTGDVMGRRPDEVTVDDIIKQEYRDWQPVYLKDRGPGKVMNIAGHGTNYIYPMEVLQGAPLVYVVGGELKALLMNQVGLPTVTFTGGEGSYSNDLLPFFAGKKVRVLFDADPEKKRDADGLSDIDHKADSVALAILQAGAAEVEVGRWQKFVMDNLPAGGDVTDLLVRTELSPIAVEQGMAWKKVRIQSNTGESKTLRSPKNMMPKDESEIEVTTVAGLRHATNVDKWFRVTGVVAGRDATPSVVPSVVSVSCAEGRTNERKACKSCSLPGCGFAKRLVIDSTAQIDFVGMPLEAANKALMKVLGVNPRCDAPDIDRENNAAQAFVIAPPVDAVDSDYDGQEQEDTTSVATTWVLSDGKRRLIDGVPYRFTMKVIPDPKNSRFTSACIKVEDVVSRVHSFDENLRDEASNRLDAISSMDLRSALDRVIGDFRDFHVKSIRGADDMMFAILAGLFMPLDFEVGGERNARACASVLVLGDTTTGKSTVCSAAHRLYGVGKMIAADARPTYAGLIGGINMDNGTPMFQWGPIPLANNGALAFDETGRLDPEIIAGLTSMLSSGKAERRTRQGSAVTDARIRITYLSNPRGVNRLTDYRNPMDAAYELFLTPQDLGRVDFMHVQYQVKDDSSFTIRQLPKRECLYDKESARRHISWAWTRGSKGVVFSDPEYLFRRALELAKSLNNNLLLLAPMARFKLAKLAVAIAMIACRRYVKEGVFTHTCVVDNACVDVAYESIYSRYESYSSGQFQSGAITAADSKLLSPELIAILERVPHIDKLHMLASGEGFYNMRDFREAFGSSDVALAFVDQWYNIEGKATMGGYARYIPRDPISFARGMAGYIQTRIARKEGRK